MQRREQLVILMLFNFSPLDREIFLLFCSMFKLKGHDSVDILASEFNWFHLVSKKTTFFFLNMKKVKSEFSLKAYSFLKEKFSKPSLRVATKQIIFTYFKEID